MSRYPLAISLAFIVGYAGVALAQSQAAPPSAPAASGAYRSALESYRSFDDQTVAPWKRTNETVREVGGWRAYAREAQAAASSRAPAASSAASSAASAAASPAASSAASPHAGHH